MAQVDLESSLHRQDTLELRVWLRLLTCTQMISTKVRLALREQFSTTLPRFDALAQLDRVPEGLPMSELSRRLMVTGGNVTAIVDRLLEEQLVTRVADPDDRRRQIVTLTAKGRQRFKQMAPTHQVWIDDIMHDIDPSTLQQLYTILGQLKQSAEQSTPSS